MDVRRSLLKVSKVKIITLSIITALSMAAVIVWAITTIGIISTILRPESYIIPITNPNTATANMMRTTGMTVSSTISTVTYNPAHYIEFTGQNTLLLFPLTEIYKYICKI